jgi:hypothetical protein
VPKDEKWQKIGRTCILFFFRQAAKKKARVLPSGPVFPLITVGENNLGGRQKSIFLSLLGEYIPTSARTLGVWCKNNVLTSVTSVRTGFTPMLLHWSQCYYIGVVLHCFKNVWVHK